METKCKRPKDTWIKPDTFALLEKKRECGREGDHYKTLWKQVRKHLRRDREEHLESICGEMESAQSANNARDMFRSMNRLTKHACPLVKLVNSESGATLTEDPEIIVSWRGVYYTTEQADHILPSEGLKEAIQTF